MIPCDPATGGADAFAAAYEQLRSRVLSGSVSQNHLGLGLVVLLREGIAAWMARGFAGLAPVEPQAQPHLRGAAPVLSDEIHAGVVHVLASIAQARREEMKA